MACTHRFTNAHNHICTVCSCHKTNCLNYGCCCTMTVTTSKALGVIHVHSSYRQHGKKKKKRKVENARLFMRLFLVATVVGS